MKTNTTFLLQNLLQANNSNPVNTTSSKLFTDFKECNFSSFHFSLYLSNRDSKNHLVHPELFYFYFEKIKSNIIDVFGGVSIAELKGFYKSINGSVIAENITVFSFHNFNTTIEFEKIHQIVNDFIEFGLKSNQECLLLTYNNISSLLYL